MQRAIAAEAAPFIEHLGLQPFDIFPAYAPIRCFTGLHNGYKVSVIQPGKCATHSVCNVSAWLAASLAAAVSADLSI